MVSFFPSIFSFLYPPKCFAKIVDRWTSSENSENFNDNCTYFIIQKCGYVDKKLFLCFMFSFFLVPFKFLSKSVDRWTSSEKISNPCMPLLESTVYFFLQKVWTGGQALKILIILMASVCISLFKNVDMWTRSCLCISCFLSFLYLLKYLQKVWTGGQALSFLRKKCQLHVFHFSKVWICGQEAVFLSHVFFLSFFLVPFNFFLQKVWTCGRALNILKKNSTPRMSLLESVDMWTRSCLSISCFLSLLYAAKYFQKVWTGGQVLKVLKKPNFNLILFIFKKCGRVDKCGQVFKL